MTSLRPTPASFTPFGARMVADRWLLRTLGLNGVFGLVAISAAISLAIYGLTIYGLTLVGALLVRPWRGR